MKTIALFLLMSFAAFSGWAQDQIITRKGDTILCKITSEKKNRIYFDYFHKEEVRHTLLYRSQITAYRRGVADSLVFPEQEDPADQWRPPAGPWIGPGFGMDYGGFGLQIEWQIAQSGLSLFVGGGYNTLELGINGGLSMRILPQKALTPVVKAMYGYNAVLKFKGQDALSKTYYGFTPGAGLQYGDGKTRYEFLLLVPIRSQQFHEDYDGYKAAGMEFNPDILPVAVSLGIRFSLGH